MPDALTRVPTFSGPIWPCSLGRSSRRFAGSTASLPSGLNSGTTTSVSSPSRSAFWPSSRSRISIRLDSLPSTSPAWIPLMISTTGRPRRRASSGVRTPCADSTHSGRSRPPGLVPNDDTARRGSRRAASPAMNSITWAWSEVSLYEVASARVSGGIAASCHAGPANARPSRLDRLGAARRERARHLELRRAALVLDLDLDRVEIDRHVARDHVGDLAPHLLQLAALQPDPVVGQDQVEAALGDLPARWLPAKDVPHTDSVSDLAGPRPRLPTRTPA